MIGAIVQITTKNTQDTLLTGKPVFNFIKQVYKQYDNFAIEELDILTNEPVDFGKKITFTIDKIGDLLHKMFFCFTLPQLNSTSGTYAAWTNSIGHALMDTIDIVINGERFDRKYGLFLEIWNELTTDRGPNDKLIGKYTHTSMLQYNALQSSEYKVPLNFWFTEYIGSALPLYKLQNSSIQIEIQLNTFDRCIIYDGITPPLSAKISNTYLKTQYIFVDDTFKTKSESSPRYLIEQLGYFKPSNISKADLLFNNPCKELIFVFREKESELNNDYFNFSIRNNAVFTTVQPILESAKLVLDTKDRNEYKSSYELSRLNNSIYHKGTDKHIYSMPFCNEPEKWIPTGSLNFSAFTHVSLFSQLIPSFPPSHLYIFARNYNWIIIENGFARFTFQS
jgi:hypothetical protein